jgi:hypothetical protein
LLLFSSVREDGEGWDQRKEARKLERRMKLRKLID